MIFSLCFPKNTYICKDTISPPFWHDDVITEKERLRSRFKRIYSRSHILPNNYCNNILTYKTT